MRRYFNILTPGVKYLILRVTNRCNATCSFCLNRYFQTNSATGSQELTVDEYERIAAFLPGLVLLNLSGGEPYLRSDLSSIASAFIQRSGVRLISSPTNGTFPDATIEFADRVLTDHKGVILKVGISIDEIGDKHDAIRGLAHGYSKSLETAKRLNELKKRHVNLIVHAVTTVSTSNVRSLNSIMDELAAQKLFDGHFFALVRGPEMRLTAEEFNMYQKASSRLLYEKNETNMLKDLLFKSIIKTMSVDIERSFIGKKNSFVCPAGNKLVNITEQGELCICELLENASLGNVRKFAYDSYRILRLPENVKRLQSIGHHGCDCHWDCAIYASLLFGGIRGYCRILGNML